MKTYEETAIAVLRRAEEENELIKRKRARLGRIGLPLAAALLIGAGLLAVLAQSRLPAKRIEKAAVRIPSMHFGSDERSKGLVAMHLWHGGSVYTPVDCLSDEEARAMLPLLDETIGKAKGGIYDPDKNPNWNINAGRELYSAGFERCEVCTVKGYDPAFRLAVKSIALYQGLTPKYIYILENHSGIRLDTGADLFKDRLNIPGRVVKAEYLTHAEHGGKSTAELHSMELHPLGVTGEQLDAFIEAIVEAPLLDLREKAWDVREFFGEDYLFLYLTLEDGLRVELIVSEAGCAYNAGYMRWFPAAAQEEALRPIVEAMRAGG